MNISKHGYWLDKNPEQTYDSPLGQELIKIFKGQSVLDLGCGDGKYVKFFHDAGIDCKGYDGNPNTSIITKEECYELDLAIPFNMGVRDWVLSLEVGEHIPKEYEKIFIDNIHRHNKKGVIISWAVEGQGGDGHVNERSNEYIKSIFSGLGYKNDISRENSLRGIAERYWFRNTLMVFLHE